VAQRRMISKKIIETDKFIDMPSTARLLYYDLLLRADDEGFVGHPRAVTRLTGASNDDLTLLIAKQYLVPFETGICVIKEWKVHNYIQNDRFTATSHAEERAMLTVDNGVYVEKTDPKNVSILDTQVRLGKVSIEKKKNGHGPLDHDSLFVNIWDVYPRKEGKKEAFKHFKKSIKSIDDMYMIWAALANYVEGMENQGTEKQYYMKGKTWFNNWEDYIDHDPGEYVSEEDELNKFRKELGLK